MGSPHYLEQELYEQVRSRPEIFEFIQAGSLDGIWYWNLDNPDHEWMSARFWETLGFDPLTRNHLASEWRNLIHPDDLKVAIDNFQKHCADPKHPYDQVVRYRHRDGSTVWIRCRGMAIRDGSGKAVRMLGAHTNVTSLKVTEERLRVVIESVPTSLIVTEAGDRISLVNHQVERTFGYARQELLGRSVEMLIPERLRGEYQRMRIGSLADPESRAAEGSGTFFGLAKNGVEVPIEIRLNPFKMERGGLLLLTITDITERGRAEAERRKLEAQLQQAQRLESMGILAGGIAHDFNNLLTGILGYADLAQLKLPLGSSSRDFITEVIKGARQAADLTKQMLAYSGKGKFVITSISLSSLVEEMARLLEISISKKCVIQYHLMPDLPSCDGDTAQIRQVIMNLITNAAEAIGDRSGVIAVSTGIRHCDRRYLSNSTLNDNVPEGMYVYLEVSDTGCGMSEETRAKMFDPFFTTKFTGRGLGLAALQGIVRGHRGAIMVYTELGKGTSFKILLPMTAGPASLKQAGTDESTAWRGSGTVLIVDDEESVQGLARHMLENMGFTVRIAGDGREALEIFRKESGNIRLILLDMTMPHLDGEQTFQGLRAISSDVRVILSSGYNEQTATNRFVGKGLAAFLQKPYQYAQLLEVVQKALGDKAAPGAKGI